MKLSKNFNLDEFLVSDSYPELMKNVHVPDHHKWNLFKLCRILIQNIRDAANQPVKITSGYRTLDLNKALGGAKNSQHLYGEACDYVILDKDGKVDQKAMERSIQFAKVALAFAIGQHIVYYNEDGSIRHIHVSLPAPSCYGEFFTKTIKGKK